MDTLVSDNGPQFASAEFKSFAQTYGFEHITSSPLYPKSNGLAEKSVQTVKNLIKKCSDSGDDIYLALLDLRNTPRDDEMGSPMQRLMSRRAKTRLPISENLRKPSSINPSVVSNRLMDYRQKQKFYYDQNAKERAQCREGDSVRIHTPDGWKPAEYIKQSSEPRSHIVKAGSSGRLYRRNNSMLLKTREDPHIIQEHKEAGNKVVSPEAQSVQPKFAPPQPQSVVAKPAQSANEHIPKDPSQKRLTTRSGRDDPYVFARNKNPDGSIKYTGFVIDILDMISERLNFTYDIVKNADDYGSCTGKKSCTGMMKELVTHKADLAAAGMTITAERDEYVDFTKPFKNLGITILIKKPKVKAPNLFSFLDPFHPNVWMFMVAGFICVTIMLFISARFSPYEWNPEEGSEESDIVVNQFSISNSVWFTIGCILQQGSDLSPLATSTRTIAVVWWFFTLILISSYTANLAAFLTFSKDMSTTYAKVWNFMKSEQGVLVDSSKDGIQKVLDDDYAFFAESTSVEYHVQRKCQLMQVGGELNSIGYGLALPEGSPFLKNISMAIIQLNEEQEIKNLSDHWWKTMDGGGACPVEEKNENDIALKMENVAGVFVVLIGGCCAAVLVAICEFLWMANKNARRDEVRANIYNHFVTKY
ncbi:hypothetical protein FSP39_000658 [Pinctada imbricata]|uniref:Integrase catalytic domain-containing protein n=1 Tax=Pinctada imbricata TaxID=66713 RepID=A0AA89C8T3_PINIB|nr:hypothetical protein FSP39_000658 [Pinctada imbricata]